MPRMAATLDPSVAWRLLLRLRHDAAPWRCGANASLVSHTPPRNGEHPQSGAKVQGGFSSPSWQDIGRFARIVHPVLKLGTLVGRPVAEAVAVERQLQQTRSPMEPFG